MRLAEYANCATWSPLAPSPDNLAQFAQPEFAQHTACELLLQPVVDLFAGRADGKLLRIAARRPHLAA